MCLAILNRLSPAESLQPSYILWVFFFTLCQEFLILNILLLTILCFLEKMETIKPLSKCFIHIQKKDVGISLT